MSASFDDYRWLVSDAALPWLELAASGISMRRVAFLRKDLSAVRAHLVMEQVELRERAREKFSLAGRMFFTRKGLEQATDEQLAAYKAARFEAPRRCADLCCGIGGDLIALARRGSATGIDLEAIAKIFAEANLAACGACRNQSNVGLQDAADVDVANFAAWHCDPDRRAEGKRTTRVESFAPSFDVLNRLLARNANAAIKLAPATEAPASWADQAELEWLGSRGECRQQVTWFGELARHPGKRSATIVESNLDPRTIVGIGSEFLPSAPQLGRYLYEPHAAVLAAKLAGALCDEHALASVSAGVAYLTGDRLVDDAALAAFEVIEVLPLDRKQLKAYCRQHGIGRLEVKKRGVEIDPARLRKEIIGSGDEEATLIVSPVLGQARAVFAKRQGGT